MDVHEENVETSECIFDWRSETYAKLEDLQQDIENASSPGFGFDGSVWGREKQMYDTKQAIQEVL